MCLVQYMLIIWLDTELYELFQYNQHNTDSHSKCKSKFLTPLQEEVIDRTLLTYAMTTVKYICQQSNMLPDEDQQIGSALGPSVEHHVWKVHNVLLAKQMDGIEMSGKTEILILKEMCEAQ